MKEHHESTRETLSNHSADMSKLSTGITSMKIEFMRDVERVMVNLSKVEREMKTLEHSIGIKSEIFDKKISDINDIKKELTEMCEKIKIIDKKGKLLHE